MCRELLMACVKNDINQVKELLEEPFDIRYKDKYNRTCLYYACFHNNIELVNLFLDAGAKDIINDIGIFNWSCLHRACSNNNIELAKLLLDAGAKNTINVIDEYNETCLSWACWNNNIQLVELLLKNGAIVDNKTMDKYYNYLLKMRI